MKCPFCDKKMEFVSGNFYDGYEYTCYCDGMKKYKQLKKDIRTKEEELLKAKKDLNDFVNQTNIVNKINDKEKELEQIKETYNWLLEKKECYISKYEY